MPDELGGAPDLIDRLNAGDRSTGDELFTQFYRRLVHLSGLMLGTFPDLSRQYDAESLVHLGGIDLQTALRSVKPEGLPEYADPKPLTSTDGIWLRLKGPAGGLTQAASAMN
jgi:hypothetical protein